MPDRPPPSGPSPRQLTMLYVLALSLVATLSVAGQLLVQFSLRRQMTDSRVVNIAGRQRMLSQRIAKSLLQLVNDQRPGDRNRADPRRRARLADELERSVMLLRRCQRGLRDGDPRLNLPGDNSETVQRMFAAVDPVYEQLHRAASTAASILQGETDVLRPTIQKLSDRVMQAEPSYLAAMDAIVFQFDREARNRVARLRTVEKALLATTLLVLTLEGCLIFRPAIRRIRHSMGTLQSATEHLAIARDQAQKASAAKSQFLSTLSHELRTPMNAIVGLTDQLMRTQVEPAQRKMLQAVQGGANTLANLLTDLLDASRLESSQLPQINHQPVDVVQLAEQSVTLARPANATSELDMRLRIDPNMPRVFSTDPGRLQQLLLNLLTNAIKYTPSGFVELSVAPVPSGADHLVAGAPRAKASADSSGHCVQQIAFSVRDTGVGIPAAQHEQIFRSFTQLAPARQLDSGGVGLGLFIASKIVEAMGGRIELDSVPDQGSTFRVVLPLEAAGDDAAGPTPCRHFAASARWNGAHWKLLVAEDNPANQLVFTSFLDSFQCDYEVVADGNEAVAAYQRERFDLVLMDLSMPNLSGIEACRAIARHCDQRDVAAAPILGVTAHLNPELRQQGKAAGICDWLTKPITGDRLAEKLDHYLSAKARGRERTGDDDDRRSPLPRGLYVKVARAALDDLPDLAAQLSFAVDRQHYNRIAFLAHRICGTIAYLNATRLTAACRELETAAEHQQADWIRSLYPSLRRHLESFQKELSKFR